MLNKVFGIFYDSYLQVANNSSYKDLPLKSQIMCQI